MLEKYFKIMTYGCQMNENDSEKISGLLKDLGYQPTDEDNKADMVILNTCSVRENANDKFFGHLGKYKKLKEQKPNLILSICGCMMQQEEIVNEIKRKYRFVDLIFGTHNIHVFPDLLSDFLERREMVVNVWEDGEQIVEGLPTDRKYSFKAYVSIMNGCNNFCSYCIVPYTRGRERSREPENIVKEVQSLAQSGCKEITLLGQNVNSYGKTLDSNYSFADLLKDVNNIEGIERIRFMTSHPKDISDDVISCYATLDKLCEHLHLPIQSGSNKILKAMNRKYSREDYLTIIKKVKNVLPDIAITTDIIVGFPGETEEDFEETLDIVKKVQYDSAFTFLYSIREGTKAATMENQVPDDVKHERFQRLLDTLYPIGLEKNEKLIGEIVEVLVEDVSKNNDKILNGRTRSSKLVHFPGDKELIGKLINVRIDEVKTFTLEGTIV
jgi:tRNA-2-methylthio-N6-dimethylallyladenosine synthase